MGVIFCHGCGKEVYSSAAFCPHCGAAQQATLETVPDSVKGWSWGAFFLNWIWAIGNRVWLGLLALIPFVGFIVSIWLGFKGREMAWKSRSWDSIEHFNSAQKKWSQWGVGIFLVLSVLVALTTMPVYQDYQRRAASVEAEKAAGGEVASAKGNAETSAESTKDDPASYTDGLIPRDKFREMFSGKSKEYVIKVLGKPDDTMEASGMVIWTYNKRTMDPTTGNADMEVNITFMDGVVNQMMFA